MCSRSGPSFSSLQQYATTNIFCLPAHSIFNNIYTHHEHYTMSQVKIPVFSEEVKLLISAIMCLKSGFSEVDYTRLQDLHGFNTLKPAQNTWAVLKKKIITLNPEAAAAEAGKSSVLCF